MLYTSEYINRIRQTDIEKNINKRFCNISHFLTSIDPCW